MSSSVGNNISKGKIGVGKNLLTVSSSGQQSTNAISDSNDHLSTSPPATLGGYRISIDSIGAGNTESNVKIRFTNDGGHESQLSAAW